MSFAECKERLVNNLFKTEALKICPENKPFWYTSGKIGPYYINTHFLYGNETLANNLLEIIDDNKDNPEILNAKVFNETLNNYNNNPIYKSLIDYMVYFIKKNIDIDQISYISGGERRDWFFSFIIAHFLNKPHITIFKDKTLKLYNKGETSDISNINGALVLHIADLITEASSYERAWIPAISSIGGRIVSSVVVVDRMQGGAKKLEDNNISSYHMISIDTDLFNRALEKGYINEGQYNMIKSYLEDQDAAMKKFILNNPDFLKNSLNSDDVKIAERAQLCIKNNFYN